LVGAGGGGIATDGTDVFGKADEEAGAVDDPDAPEDAGVVEPDPADAGAAPAGVT
jgi:hypothetical protein